MPAAASWIWGRKRGEMKLGFERMVGRIFNLCCAVTRAVDQYD
jgi:hypothetical protein